MKIVKDLRTNTGGEQRFIIIAYPAEYSDATHRTYIIDATGVVCERDLGPRTHEYISNLDELDPTGWTPAEKW